MSEIAKMAVEKIVDDIRGRSGLGNVWDEIDRDIQDEMKKLWGDFIDEAMASK